MDDKIRFSGETDVGLKRQNNEDAFVCRPDLNLCVVADGMGGAAAGEIASKIFIETAVEVFSNHVDANQRDVVKQIQDVFGLANDRILKDVETAPHRKGMGCTAEVIAFTQDGFVLGHMGDSRTYRLRDGEFKQLSSDHSFVQEQIDKGIITPEEAKRHPMRHIILRAVGVKENVALDILRGKTYPGDQYLLCSDGLTDMIEDSTIAEVLSGAVLLDQKAKHLVELAKNAGGKDNITVVLAEII